MQASSSASRGRSRANRCPNRAPRWLRRRLQAENPVRRNLPVIPDVTTTDHTGGGLIRNRPGYSRPGTDRTPHRRLRRCHRLSTDIEAGPVVDGGAATARLGIRPRGHIGGEGLTVSKGGDGGGDKTIFFISNALFFNTSECSTKNESHPSPKLEPIVCHPSATCKHNRTRIWVPAREIQFIKSTFTKLNRMAWIWTFCGQIAAVVADWVQLCPAAEGNLTPEV